MEKSDLAAVAADFVMESEWNRVREKDALRRDLIGLRLFDPPLIGYAGAGDPSFAELRRPEVIGPHFRLPGDWLPDAKTVLSYFLPFTERVIAANRLDPEWPSPEWLHARTEGQIFVDKLATHLVEFLDGNGYQALAPGLTGDFWSWIQPAGRRAGGEAVPGYTSNWSERHVAHVAGLGTFGLSAGLITERGSAGRIGSVVTNLSLEPDPRPYRQYDEYCRRCGACVERCFVRALSTGSGKDKGVCSEALDRTRERHWPRYGCAKCHVSVPCESCRP